MCLAERKRELREALAGRRARVSSRDAEAAALAVAERLVACQEFERASRVALYAALPDELPTAALLQLARDAGKAVLWPRFVRGSPLEFAGCAPEALVTGRHGVPMPPVSSPSVALGDGDLVVVPCVAFDEAGRRLGRGGGYYDRTFPPTRPSPTLLAGVGYAFQLLDCVPAGPRDRRLDLIVTERAVLRSAPPAPHPAAGLPDTP